MTSVSVDKDLFVELIDFRLASITTEINRILAKWNYRSIEKFLEDGRKGVLAEVEDDGIDLTNLVAMRDQLYKLRPK